MRITFVLRRLESGGAERQLAHLATQLQSRGTVITIVAMYGHGCLEHDCREAGVAVRVVGKRGRWDLLCFAYRFFRECYRSRPDILCGWMPIENLLVSAYRALHRSVRLVWSVRATTLDLARYDWVTRLVYRAQRVFVKSPDLILVNSRGGAQLLGLRHDDQRVLVISNALDTRRFFPSAILRARFREQHLLDLRAFVVGIVGRLDPMKGHESLFDAMRILRDNGTRANLLVVGTGSVDYRQRLKTAAATAGIASAITWMDSVRDIESVYNGIDVLVSASLFGEGTQNVLLEAMACGTPVVATDVGEARQVVSAEDIIVPAGDSAALAAAIREQLAQIGLEPRRARRAHVERHFGPEGSTSIVLAAFTALRGL